VTSDTRALAALETSGAEFPSIAPPSKWLGGVVFVWTTLVVARGLLGGVNPRFHWLVSAVAVIFIAPFLLRVTLRVPSPGLFPAWLLAIAVLLSSLGSPDSLYGLAEAGKLAIMLVVALTLFVTHSRYAHYAYRAFVFSVLLNVVLLIAGFLGIVALSREMMLGRRGTFLDYPGSLWRVGILTVCWSAHLVIAREKPLRYLAILAASLALIYFDGSRTGFLLSLLAAPFLVIVRVLEGRSLFSRLTVAGAAVVLTLTLVAGWNWAASRRDPSQASGALGRIALLASSARFDGMAGLVAADRTRARMLQAGVATLRDAHLIGTGIQTTRIETEEGFMVVHMTYLQVLGDLGLLGFLSYIWLTLGWVPWLPRALANVRRLPDTLQRAVYYNAIFLLFFFALAGLLHPLSTEWAEWVTFMIPYALFWEAVRATPTPVLPQGAD